MDDSKLKFLPRHLQRTQPAGTHKSKRRVTLENEEAGDEDIDRRKPSVFERLGPGASQRTEKTTLCIEFQEHGTCQYGNNCPYSHNVKTKGQSKRDDKESNDSMRLKFKGQSGKDRESKVKSQVVVRKSGGGGDSDDDTGEDSDSWSIDKLASKKEMELEKKRQEIQRALSALEATEDVDDHKKHSESSNSSSSPERPAKKKKEKASKKEKRKKHKKNAPEKEKTKDLKRKLDSDEEDSSQKNQKKRKKKKQKHVEEVQREASTGGKAKKLLSPLKKVLKQKKGSDPVASVKRSSKRHRSESVDISSRRRERSVEQDSSSESSRSPTPVKRKKLSAPESSHGQEKMTKKRSRSLEKKRHSGRRGDRRSVSSSSSSSSAASSSISSQSKSRSRATRSRKPEPQKSRQPQAGSPGHARKDRRGDKKKRDKSTESWTGGKDSNADRSKRRQGASSSQPDKVRGARDRADQYGVAATSSSSGKQGKRRLKEASSKGSGRNDGKDNKESTAEARGSSARADWDKDGKRDKRRADGVRDREEERTGRQEKGSNNRDSRERKGSSERQDRMRRGAGFGMGHSFGQQSSHHGGQRPLEGDRDNRHYDESSGRFAPDMPPRAMSQFQAERQRASERGEVFDRRDRDVSDSRNDRGPGRFNRGNDSGDGRGWDDRRHGGDNMGRDEWNGRERALGQFPPNDDAREFGRRREDRRGGREERLLPHLGDNEPPKDSRFSQLGDGRNQRGGPGNRDDFAKDRGGVRDWKLLEASHDSSARRDAGVGDSEDRSRAESRDRSRTGANVRSADNSRDKVSDKDPDKVKRDVSGKISSSGVLKLKSQPTKEDSPVTRDEPSLASLFSQTETVLPVKKKTTKSFGGKKSPKKSEDNKSDKSKPGLATRLGARLRRHPEKKPGIVAGKTNEEKPRESEKSDKAKDKSVKSGSPKDSHKSEESPRSRQSQSKTRRSSKSPDAKKPASTRSPVSNRGSDNSKSEARQSRSPAPSSGRDRDKRETSQKAPATSGTRDRRRREESKRPGDQHKSQPDRGKKRDRSRSRSSEKESHLSVDDKKRRRSSDSDSIPAKLEGGDIAAAMLGDGIDDGQQEEKVFSDWSDDDDADNILMGGDSRKPHLHHHGMGMEERVRGFMDLGRGPLHHHHHHRRLLPPLIHGHYGEMKDMRSELEQRMDPLKEKPVLEKNIPNVKIVEDIQKEKPARERRRRDTDNEGYEEISSDENDLDEEGEKVNKRTIVSILDIDLTSLIPAVKPKTVTGPVFMRYKAANVFAELGVSQRFAGAKLFKEVQETCQRQLEEMASEQEAQVMEIQQSKDSSGEMVKQESKPIVSLSTGDNDKAPVTGTEEPMTEPILSPPDTPLGVDEFEDRGEVKPEISALNSLNSAAASSQIQTKKVKEEKIDSSQNQRPSFALYSDSCAIHRYLKSRVKERAGLFYNSTMLSRALTARRDLDIRRRLCRVPHNFDQSAIYPSGVIDQDFHQMCSQLFKQNRPLMLPKDVTASC